MGIIKLRKMNSYNAIQIFVVSLKGEQLAIDFDANDTVEVLKAKIQTVEGTPVAEQNIFFAGKLLEDGHALAEYNLQKEATVQLTTAVEGGMFWFYDFDAICSIY